MARKRHSAMMSMLSLLLAVVSVLASAPVRAVEVDGTWSGTVQLGGDERKLIVTFESSGTGLTGTFIIDTVEEANDALRRFGATGVIGRSITLEDMPRFRVTNGEMHGGVLVFDVELPNVVLQFVLDAVGRDTLVGSMERIPRNSSFADRVDERRGTGRVTLHRDPR